MYQNRDYKITFTPRPDLLNLEQQLIEEIYKINSIESREDEEKQQAGLSEALPSIDKRKPHQRFNHLLEILDLLVLNIIEENKILSLLIYIAAIEDDEELTNLIKQKTDNFEGYLTQESAFGNTPLGMVTSDARILNSSFSYAIKIRSINVIEYILDGADRYFLNPSIDDDLILELITQQKDEK